MTGDLSVILKLLKQNPYLNDWKDWEGQRNKVINRRPETWMPTVKLSLIFSVLWNVDIFPKIIHSATDLHLILYVLQSHC